MHAVGNGLTETPLSASILVHIEASVQYNKVGIVDLNARLRTKILGCKTFCPVSIRVSLPEWFLFTESWAEGCGNSQRGYRTVSKPGGTPEGGACDRVTDDDTIVLITNGCYENLSI